MKAKAFEILIVFLFVLAFFGGCEDETEDIEQEYHRGWGKIPKQNNCPHCGEISYTRFCTDCKKERGNLAFIGVYCPKCDPKGQYPSQTDDVTQICGNCGSERTWKYVYKDWQSEPEPNEPKNVIPTWPE